MFAQAIEKVRQVRRQIETDRRQARPDVARELSIAITALEDAEVRLARAELRITRNAGDGDAAVDKATDELLAEADSQIEPEKEVKSK